MREDSRKADIIGGLAGIVFAVLFVVGALAPNTPDTDQPAKWVHYFSSSGNRADMIIAGYLWVVAGLALIIMIAAAYQRFGGRPGVSGLWANVAGIAAIIFAAVLLIGGVATASIAGNVAFGGTKVPADGDLIAQVTGLGTAIVLFAGGLTAALALAATSVVILMERGARWLAILGFIAAICCIFGVVFVPMVALPIWVIVASIVLLRGRSEAAVRTPEPAAA